MVCSFRNPRRIRKATVHGRTVPIIWRGRAAEAWIPDTIAERSLDLRVETARRTERALAAVRAADTRLAGGFEPLARLLLRSEGIASSEIEGIRAPVAEVVAAELDPDAVGPDSAWIADNLAVVDDALEHARSGDLTVETLHRWHALLMRHGHLPDAMVGTFRFTQGWIGGASPLDAAFVPPPAEAIAVLMDDLIAFSNRANIDPLTQAAVVHAQFETVHPYADGNGRIGRVLIGWVLVRRERLAAPPPPVSLMIAGEIGGYLSGLVAYRTTLDTWVSWFAGVVERAGLATQALGDRLARLLDDWRGRTDDLRTDAAARRALGVLASHPVMTAPRLAQHLGVSDRTARSALDALADRDIVRPFATATLRRGRPPSAWVAPEVTDIVASWGT